MSKNKQIICYFIVLFMLISGMCFERSRADSIFVCTPTGLKTSYIQAVDTAEYDVEGQAVETLDFRGASYVQQIADCITNNHRVFRNIWVFACVTVLAQILPNFCVAAYIEQFLKFVYQTVVVTYIHDMDGKKRI